jgi:glucosamine 6-phosphate synthetase-like amidotransferase/phosphosugar isomerase protein
MGYLATLGICNVPESALVRESDLVLMTRAGPEVGVASTKVFTTQLAALSLLGLSLARRHGLGKDEEADLVRHLAGVPALMEHALELDRDIELFMFADPDAGIGNGPGVTVLEMPDHIEGFQAPIAFTLPLQLLAYQVAVLKGTDVDQPRNLAKSVTVE